LSLDTASRHYPATSLVTDDAGARILVDCLQLPFAHVSTALNELQNEDPDWWALGKIEAYRRQTGPFVHIDYDVFLWKPLPPELERAAVFAQNPEPVMAGYSFYRPADIERAIGYPERGWLPEEWFAFDDHPVPHGACCGILGGNDVALLVHYAETALRLLRDPENRTAMRVLSGKGEHMMLVEQYLVTLCAAHCGVEFRYLIDDIRDAFHTERAMDLGYTHLASAAKQNRRVAAHLERRVQEDLPEYYERCKKVVTDGTTICTMS
jgi:hypothetical protein